MMRPLGHQKPLWGRMQSLWPALRPDLLTVQGMVKGALAPTICLAAFQANAYSAKYETTGFLMAIAALLSFPTLPRGQIYSHVILLVLGLLVALPAVLFAFFCCLKARTGATPSVTGTISGPNAQSYSSSAAGVVGVFSFILIWLISILRVRFPQFAQPGRLVIIFTNTCLIYAPQETTMAGAIKLVLASFEAVLTGVAIALGVSLVVFPRNMRMVVFQDMAQFIMAMRNLITANCEYIRSLEKGDMFHRTPSSLRPRKTEAQNIKDVVENLSALNAKLAVDLPFAKKEVAYGKLGPKDLSEISQRLRDLFFVLVGFSSLNDIFERIAQSHGWTDIVDDADVSERSGGAETPADTSTNSGNTQPDYYHTRSVNDWHQISLMLRGPFEYFGGHVNHAFSHILLRLQLLPRGSMTVPEKETAGFHAKPGEVGFAREFKKTIHDFSNQKAEILDQFCRFRGVDSLSTYYDRPKLGKMQSPDSTRFAQDDDYERFRRQLYIILWMHHLLETIGVRVLDLCLYVDQKAENGKLDRSRLILPGKNRVRKYFKGLFSTNAASYSNNASMGDEGSQASEIHLGPGYFGQRDPEHLPPETMTERIGENIRNTSHFLRSKESIFGLRVALATTCAAMIGLTASTRTFYITNRGFWAQNIIALSMVPSAAQSLFLFFLRIIATVSAMCTSIAVWYIVGGKVPGVLVLYWVITTWGFYFIVKFPKLLPLGLIFNMTNTLIIGYEVQTAKIGRAESVASGQADYPAYLLGVDRMAMVMIGLALAYIWTMFPFPLSEHSELRRDLGSALHLLANYNSLMDEVAGARIRGELDVNERERSLLLKRHQKVCHKVHAKSALTIQALRMHVYLLKYDFSIGGRFPKEIYVKIIDRMQSIFNFITLATLASETFVDKTDSATAASNATPPQEEIWLKDFRRLIDTMKMPKQQYTTLLSILSASVMRGNPLPPFLELPRPFALARKLDSMDNRILGVEHIEVPAFAAFACMQIGTKCINDDVIALIKDVKELVGVMDFSFHAPSSNDDDHTVDSRKND